MKLELLAPLTYMHILHTSGNTKREPDLPFLDSVGLLRVCVRVCVCPSVIRSTEKANSSAVMSTLICSVLTESLSTEDGRLAAPFTLPQKHFVFFVLQVCLC